MTAVHAAGRRPTKRRPTKRQPRRGRRGFGAAIALVASVAVLAGCTPPNLPPPIAPSVAPSAPSSTDPGEPWIIGVDGTVSGFNPHSLADFSPAARAVESLVLPSTTITHPDGSITFDPAVVESAEITGTDPFVVTYTLNRSAAWSDGTPVTAEDFEYLWNQMLVQPGTVDPAGYRMIGQIRSREAGKVVDVQFAAPLADWSTLFSPLLPAHILKDAPGGWATGLAGGIPVSANRYKMSSYDPVTGEITLVRNDKYWAGTSGPATLVLRIDEPEDLIAALGRGEIQGMWVRAGGDVTAAVDAAVPADLRTEVPLPATVQLVLNMTDGPTAERAVRSAIATALDYAALRAALTGSVDSGSDGTDPGDGMLPVDSQVRLPSQAATVPEGPPLAITGDPVAAREVLSGAGFDVDGVYARRDGQVLSLTLAVPSDEPKMVATARLVQRQLGAAGMNVDVLVDAAGPLISDRVAAGAVDLSLLTIQRNRSDAVAAASAFDCPDPAAPEPAPRTGNLSGYCAADVQALLDSALTGGAAHEPGTSVGSTAAAPTMGQTGTSVPGSPSGSADQVAADLTEVDNRLWSDLPVIPIGEPVGLLVAGPATAQLWDLGDATADQQGWLWTGPLRAVADLEE